MLVPYMVSSQFAKALCFDDVAGCCHISGLFNEVFVTSGLDEHSRASVLINLTVSGTVGRARFSLRRFDLFYHRFHIAVATSELPSYFHCLNLFISSQEHTVPPD